MGEHIKAGSDYLHSNGSTYHVTEIVLVGGRNVAKGREVKADGSLGRTVVLALDKLTPVVADTAETTQEEVLGTDCHVSSQDMANLTGNRWEDSYAAVPTAEAAHAEMMETDGGYEDTDPTDLPPSPEPTPSAVVRFHSSFSAHPSPDGTAYVVETRNGWGIGRYGFPTLEQAIRYAAERNGDNPDPTDPTPPGWDTVDTSTEDLPPARPLAPNSDASPITTDDLRQCRRELRRKVAIHCAGEAVMSAGSLGVALRTLAALDRAIGGETAPRPSTGTPGTFSGPSEPGPLGIYDRQGIPKRSRRRRRHEDKVRAPRSIFRARADRKPHPSVHGGQSPRLGFSAN